MSTYYCFGCDEERDADEHGRHERDYPEGEPRCDACYESDNERAYENSLSDFYGGSGPTTARERYVADHADKRRLG